MTRSASSQTQQSISKRDLPSQIGDVAEKLAVDPVADQVSTFLASAAAHGIPAAIAGLSAACVAPVLGYAALFGGALWLGWRKEKKGEEELRRLFGEVHEALGVIQQDAARGRDLVEAIYERKQFVWARISGSDWAEQRRRIREDVIWALREYGYGNAVGRLDAVLPPRWQHNLHDGVAGRRDSFLGRATALAAMTKAMSENDVVVLHGPGGIGKSRLAAEWARSKLDRFPAGIVFVDLSICTDLASADKLTKDAVRRLYDVTSEAEWPPRCMDESLPLLLILDNFEVLSAQTGPRLLHQLVGRFSAWRFLITTRIIPETFGLRLHVRPVEPLAPPLDVAPADAIGENDCVRLFLDRASASAKNVEVTQQDLSAIARLVRRLECLPLAIELAAAQVEYMGSIYGIAESIDSTLSLSRPDLEGLPDRQRTMRRVLEWSYQLLTDREKTLLSRLAVFGAAGFTVSAVEKVCNFDAGLGREARPMLASLARKSWLAAADFAESGTSRLYEVAREYADELFKASPHQQQVTDWCTRYVLLLLNPPLQPVRREQSDLNWERDYVRRHVQNLLQQRRPLQTGISVSRVTPLPVMVDDDTSGGFVLPSRSMKAIVFIASHFFHKRTVLRIIGSFSRTEDKNGSSTGAAS